MRRNVFGLVAQAPVWIALALTGVANAAPVFNDPIAPSDGIFVVVNAAGGIPENGAVLIEGPYNADVQVAVTVGTAGTQEGTLTRINDSPYWVWRPAQPFVAGTSVELQLMSPSDFSPTGNVVTFPIVSAIDLAKPAIMLEPSASLLSVISARACCRARVDSSATLVDSAPCFGVEYEASIQVDPGIWTSAPRMVTNQYLFRFTTGPDARPSFVGGSLAGVVLPVYREQADRYCFEITAIELPTLAEYSYGADAGCADHGALADLGKSPALPGPAELVSNACPAPPVGLEDAWCEVNAACEGEQTSTACGLYAHVCNDEPLAPLSSSRSDAGMAHAGAGGAMNETDASFETSVRKRGSDGCSVAVAQHPSSEAASGPGSWAALAAAIAARLRRRRSRARVCHADA